MLKQWTLLPGAEVVEVARGNTVEMAQLGIPPCLKLWLQRRSNPPTVLVLPDAFFRRGVVQVCLEFFLYHFLFVQGKAYGKLPADAKLTLVGTRDQLRRARRVLEVTLFGFTPDEMRKWTDLPAYGGVGRKMPEKTLHMLRHLRTWFTPKKEGFDDLKILARRAAGETARTLGATEAVKAVTDSSPLLVREFVARYRDHKLDDIKVLAWEFASITLEDAIEWRAYDEQGRALLLGDDVYIHHLGDNRFRVDQQGSDSQLVDLNFNTDQAPYLITLPPAPGPVVPDVFEVLCLGSDSGFEVEHPTTGFALCLNGQWAIVDAPVCASYMLSQYGIDATDVRVVLETHGHEDHMGSGIHFLLECLTSGQSYTYVAAEPVYRTCMVKVAAILGVAEEEAEILLTHGFRGKVPGRTRTLRIRPGLPVRLLGATWHFVWMVHPVPTTGFRIELAQGSRTYALAYSSDTAPWKGGLGMEAMIEEGFLDPKYDPLSLLVKGREDIVFWEAGGTNGDPIHFNAREWDGLCAERGVHPTTVFMHAHPMPPELRRHSLARPGMVWTIAPGRPLRTAHAVKLTATLQAFKLSDTTYWLWLFLCQGEVRTALPDTTIMAEGEKADAWYIILQGSVQVHSKGRLMGTLEGGSFFGELDLLHNEPAASTVRSTSPVVLMRIPPEIFREFVVANNLWNFFPTFWKDVYLLSQTRVFFGFPHEVVSDLARSLDHRQYPAGAAIIEQGTSGQELYVIVAGTVSIHKRREDGRTEVVCPSMGPGEIIGEYGVMVPQATRSATVRAETDVEMLVLAGEHLDRLLNGQLPLQLRLVELVKDRGLPVPTLSHKGA